LRTRPVNPATNSVANAQARARSIVRAGDAGPVAIPERRTGAMNRAQVPSSPRRSKLLFCRAIRTRRTSQLHLALGHKRGGHQELVSNLGLTEDEHRAVGVRRRNLLPNHHLGTSRPRIVQLRARHTRQPKQRINRGPISITYGNAWGETIRYTLFYETNHRVTWLQTPTRSSNTHASPRVVGLRGCSDR
jgi:hypothetical protein